MMNNSLSKFVRTSTLARATQSATQYQTVNKLSRLSSCMEPLESRTMMSATPALPTPHNLGAHKLKALPKHGASALVVPSAVTATVTSPKGIKLTWVDTDKNNTGFNILRATNGGAFSTVSQVTSRTTLSFVDATVSSNTSYTYKVQAYSATDSSPISSTAMVRTPLLAPTSLVATAQSGTKMVLTWTGTDSSAGGYYVLRSTDGVKFTSISTLTTGSAATFTDNSVTSGKSYRYEVQAFKDTNTSAVSSVATGVTPLAAPSALAVTALNSSTVHLTWKDNDASATGYQVLRSSDGKTFSSIATVVVGNATLVDDKTALPFTTYYYQIKATSTVASSPVSNTASATTPLATPTSAKVSVSSPTGITLTFSNSDPGAAGYVFLRSTDGTHYTQVGVSLIAKTTTWTDNNVTSNKAYSYEIQAVNGSSYSAPTAAVSVTTPLAAPSSLIATANSATSVTLTWTNNDSAATQYQIMRAINGSAFTTLATISGTATSTYNDSAVSSGKAYNYDVIAISSTNHSAASTIATASTPLNAPSDLHLSAVTGNSVVLTWTDHDTTATGYNILRSADGINFAPIAKLSGAALATYTDNTAVSGHQYAYQVQAYNTFATSVVCGGSVTTPLLAPTGVSVSMLGAYVNLTWTNKDSAANGYIVLRSTDGTNFTQLTQINSASAHSYTDQSVTVGTKYFYQVQAVTTGFSSAVTAAVNIVVTQQPVTKVTVTIATRNTNELVITATGTSDSLAISQTDTMLTIVANGQTTTQPIPAGGLFIYTRGGADSVVIDQTVTVRTTIETVDTGADSINCAGSNVSVWIDTGDVYTGTGTVHTVSSFAGAVSKATGASLADPKDSGTIMHVSGSLWGSGPVAGDINQGAIGDCYFLSSLAAFAGVQPSVLQESAVDMGDGTYTVQYLSQGTPQYIRVNNDVPTYGGGNYKYARPGSSGNLWAVIMEKAYAFFRTGANTYASINSGWMGSVYSALGVNSNFFYMSTVTEASLYSTLSTALSNNKEVTLGTSGSPPQLVGGHAYTLISASIDSNGVTSYVVRNPWGVSGDSLENSQGYATLTFAQMQANFLDACVAT